LIRAVTRDFKEKIVQRFSLYESLNKDMEVFYEMKQDEKKEHREKVRGAGKKIQSILKALDEFTL